MDVGPVHGTSHVLATFPIYLPYLFQNTNCPHSVMAPPNNWLNRQVQGAVASAGGFVGNVINGVGNGVSGVGRGIGDSIANTSRGLGDGVRGYGNNIKDATHASGRRAPTATNPLGLAGGSTQSAAALKNVTKRLPATKGGGSNPLGL
ncbi:hypothetical protein IWX50DRAFT_633600 [Phyllosticta citricarpa]